MNPLLSIFFLKCVKVVGGGELDISSNLSLAGYPPLGGEIWVQYIYVCMLKKHVLSISLWYLMDFCCDKEAV